MPKSRINKLQLVHPAEAPQPTGGKVTHDARGNAVWDWDVETGVLARKSVDELLGSLNSSGALSLDADSDRSRDWSGDPYNRNR